jgi:hypothetical protein
MEARPGSTREAEDALIIERAVGRVNQGWDEVQSQLKSRGQPVDCCPALA